MLSRRTICTILHRQSLRLVVTLFFFGIIKSTCAQDIHFSQFYQSPFNLNPGLTGQFSGAYRFIANQRTQWRSVTLPYTTFGMSADANQLELPDGFLNSKNGKTFETRLNTGLSLYNDKAGDSRFKTTIFNIALGKELKIGNNQRERFSAGLMIGLTSMKIDYSALQYDNQWNGFMYDPNLNSGEQFARSSRGYFNFNLGATYFNTRDKNHELVIGSSWMNIGNPEQSFFDDGYVKLDSRFIFHGAYKFQIKNQWLAQPMVLAMFQGTYQVINFGGLAHYIVSDDAWFSRSVYAGVFGRARDAGYIIAGIHYDAWDVGISYDINTSNLKPASSGKGGFEISAVYIIQKAPKTIPVKVCPQFM